MNKIFIALILSISFSYAFKIEQEFNVKTITVESKNIALFKEFYGKVVPNASKTYDLSMRFDGFITKLYTPEEYTYINKGDKLFTIYSESIYNLYDELAIAKNRSNSLYNSVKKKFDLFEINPKNKSGDDTLITSPYSGYITTHSINEGSYIKKGQKIFEITDLSSVWVLINIYQKDAEFVKLGMDVDISVDGVKKKYKGKIEKIYPSLNPKDQTISVRVAIENKEQKLFPNMFAKVKLYEESNEIIIVPKNSVIQRDGKQYVFFKEGKDFVPSEVVAQQIPEGYKISEGLAKGDVIVTNALFLLDSDAITNGLYSDDW